ncbi:MAG: methylenetetrahydrofolate reductase [Armatimonadota bacterium]|nr:methylenetetrahydrofolate reductase [Armatimonadota bacterium]
MSEGNLNKAIKSGQFVIIAECLPPRGADAAKIKACAQVLGGMVHAVGAVESEDGVRLCSLAACNHLACAGAEPILHLLTRDLNRIALQATILGAVSLGITNIFCTTGRHQVLTAESCAKGVNDVDPIQLLRIADGMRKDGLLANGQELDGKIEFILGTDTNPFAEPMELQVIALEQAIRSGADFIITQPVYNLEAFNQWVKAISQRNIPSQTYIIAAVKPLTSKDEALALREKYRHLDIPDSVLSKLDATSGIDLAVETLIALKNTEGIRGVYLMTGDNFQLAADILKASGLSRG